MRVGCTAHGRTAVGSRRSLTRTRKRNIGRCEVNNAHAGAGSSVGRGDTQILRFAQDDTSRDFLAVCLAPCAVCLAPCAVCLAPCAVCPVPCCHTTVISLLNASENRLFGIMQCTPRVISTTCVTRKEVATLHRP